MWSSPHAQHIHFKHHITLYEGAGTTTGGEKGFLLWKKRWKGRSCGRCRGYIWPGSQKGFGYFYALPTHQLHSNVRCGMHQFSLAVVSTHHTPTAPESQGVGYAKHSTMSPYKQEKELDIMCKAEVVGTCTPLLARDIWCVLWEQWQELEHHICYLSCSVEFYLNVYAALFLLISYACGLLQRSMTDT